MQSSQPVQPHPVPPQTVPADQNTKSVREGAATHASAVATIAAENDPRNAVMLLRTCMERMRRAMDALSEGRHNSKGTISPNAKKVLTYSLDNMDTYLAKLKQHVES